MAKIAFRFPKKLLLFGVCMKKKTAFYLLTDTHLVSKDSWVEGRPFTMREKGDQIALKLTPEILDSFIDKIIADKDTDTVIFNGDNVNSGDLASHRDFKERLETLKNAGKKVYVTPATHDYCSPNGEDECFQHGAVRYTAEGTEPTPFMFRKDLFDFYYDYGPKQALSIDDESKSYVVQLGEGVRLVMINDNGNGRSHCGLFEDGLEWLKGEIAAAKAAGDFVLLAVHHPVIPPWEVYRHLVEYEMYGGYKDLWKIMCDEGVRVVFTGHVHEQNIRKYTDEKGRYFYNVATVSAANAAGKMRKVVVDAENGICDITSVGLDSIKGVDLGGKSPFEHLYHINMPGILEDILPLAATDFDAAMTLADGVLPVDKLKKFSFLSKPIFKKLGKMKLYSAVKFGRVKGSLSDAQKEYAKNTPILSVLFEILRHVYPGNAPYDPETTEYIALTGVTRRLDRIVQRLHIKKLQGFIPPGSSLTEMAEDFLYNNRTGDDDTIKIDLK